MSKSSLSYWARSAKLTVKAKVEEVLPMIFLQVMQLLPQAFYFNLPELDYSLNKVGTDMLMISVKIMKKQAPFVKISKWLLWDSLSRYVKTEKTEGFRSNKAYNLGHFTIKSNKERGGRGREDRGVIQERK
ncbi:hypothetical protein IEQ34_004411 [Dendrobium chrysotoxum]|uniref:Uncharacterized protein n=1 Tax=Dendrobium chrysotoxum TaxID=161865 RepID=A0AAV7HGM6_DENCH|nr:hypothetical protein IEQ34_004411 [Dendrobium chrysotoxum]